MKKATLQSLAAAIAFSVSAGVQADDNNGRGRECSEATLQGLYVFSASGFSIVAGVAQPRAIVEFIRFNGDGTLSVPAGTYSVASNCTGSLAFGPPGPTFDLYLAPSGSEVHLIFTGGPVPGLGVVPGVLQGVAERVSR